MHRAHIEPARLVVRAKGNDVDSRFEVDEVRQHRMLRVRHGVQSPSRLPQRRRVRRIREHAGRAVACCSASTPCGSSGRIHAPCQVPAANSNLPSVDRLIYLVSADLPSDDVPLWEIVWTCNTLAPDAPLDEKIRLARRAVETLVGQNDLWRGEWPTGPVARLTESETQTLAHDDAPWHDPKHATLLVWIREEGLPPLSSPASPSHRQDRALRAAVSGVPTSEVFAHAHSSRPVGTASQRKISR